MCKTSLPSFLLALAGCAGATPNAAVPSSSADFVVELEYRPDMEPLPREGRGSLMGSGIGRASGSVGGEVRWSLYEVQSAATCELHMIGTLTHPDGSTLDFQAIGFGRRPTGGSIWDMTASAQFQSRAGTSALSGRVAAWVGRFDARTGRHRYAVHLPSREDAS
jgi:hypothetical protein